MDVDLFDFNLPERCIALRPARPRDSAKLLQVRPGEISHHCVRDLPDLLRAGDLLVLNETKVLPAALSGIRLARAVGGGGDVRVSVNLHKRTGPSVWRAFTRPAKRLRVGDEIIFSETMRAEVLDKQQNGDTGLRFNLTAAALDAAIEAQGSMPLPPYIGRKRTVDERDSQDYQTLFAKTKGSVAAPTAGLHYTHAVFAALKAKGIETARLTLHVGAGTFLPVTASDTNQHKMHAEWYDISPQAAEQINRVKAQRGRIIPVGTTALRALESASDTKGMLRAGARETDIFITPGYKFKLVDGILTNFHLPKSTLFMLVSALAGREVMQKAYRVAIENDYRFYSYGDTSLIWKDTGGFGG